MPALLLEVVSLLLPAGGDRNEAKPDAIGAWLIDGTAGGGGHSDALLSEAPPWVGLLAIDRDPHAIAEVRARLARFGERARVVAGRFGDMASLVRAEGAAPVVGVLLDLGVSSAQLDRAERGFSLRAEGPLDMDMEAGGGEAALELIRGLRVEDLAAVLAEHGELRGTRPMAETLKEAERAGRLRTTADLADLAGRHWPWLRKGGRHPATRVFQALRMEVNDELGQLSAALDAIEALLAPGGVAAVIAYHSLEDRMVKRRFRELARQRRFELCNRKPIRPGDDEVARNPRARSARLRGLRRLAEGEAA